MEDGSSAAKGSRKYQAEGFVNEVRDDRSDNTENNGPPLIRQVPEPKAKEGTREDVGKDQHGSTR
jgi:hypothetical protein